MTRGNAQWPAIQPLPPKSIVFAQSRVEQLAKLLLHSCSLSLHAHDFHNLKKSAQSTVTGDATQRTPGKQSRRKFPGTGECKEMHKGRKLLKLIPFMYNNQRF